ncbi:MAG TPA: Dyp-type peroxidase [Pyrinomonadaceae bacterium]|nr:Dyp-type peroxidase [Pyrinomonadaceae bacterium]
MAKLETEDLKDIQGIVMSGYGDLHCASYVLLQVIEPAAARRWLGSIMDQITTSEPPAEKVSALNVALTCRGLEKLGLDDDTLGTFSRPFLEGMTTLHRARILGDADENAPENWVWGGNEDAEGKPDDGSAVDILLMMFTENEDMLKALLAETSFQFKQNGVVELRTLTAGRNDDSHEHFGFADGMGQPAIEGTFQEDKAAARNVLKAGEMLLGYINDYDKPADSPMVSAARDPKPHLAPPRVAPRVATGARTNLHDLGLNGTYLVFRQLAQNVALFRHFVDEATRGLDGQLDLSASDRLAAKCVGRWQNGAPLVLSPDADDPAFKDADDFGYRDSDAHGFKCPIGSHVRRSNPRDTLGPDGPTALKTANRHRILRRGRSYGHRPKDPRIADPIDRGLLFICLNSDIERQFEFCQQTWINNPVFGGLDGEVDPLIGNISKTETSPANSDNGDAERDTIFTIQADPLRTRVHNLERFVTVKGGAYFFLPSVRALRYLASL